MSIHKSVKWIYILFTSFTDICTHLFLKNDYKYAAVNHIYALHLVGNYTKMFGLPPTHPTLIYDRIFIYYYFFKYKCFKMGGLKTVLMDSETRKTLKTRILECLRCV